MFGVFPGERKMIQPHRVKSRSELGRAKLALSQCFEAGFHVHFAKMPLLTTKIEVLARVLTIVSKVSKLCYMPCATGPTADTAETAILPMNLKRVTLICNKFRVLRFMGAVRAILFRGGLILRSAAVSKGLAAALEQW